MSLPVSGNRALQVLHRLAALTHQQAALVLILARARRPVTAGQLEARLPVVTAVEFRSVRVVSTIVHAVRHKLGAWTIRHEGAPGYVLDEELAREVRRVT